MSAFHFLVVKIVKIVVTCLNWPEFLRMRPTIETAHAQSREIKIILRAEIFVVPG